MFFKIIKLAKILKSRNFRSALKYGVAASVEHKNVLNSLGNCRTVVDIGANRGQFALIARHCFPIAKIFSFEPLSVPASIFEKVFHNGQDVQLHHVAIGPVAGEASMHVSARDDSSSLLPITSLQEDIFPGTGEVGEVVVTTCTLGDVINEQDIVANALLKLDVQGFELDCLKGCQSLLNKFEYIYCECSFVELYLGQKLAADIIVWLSNYGFVLKGMYNPSYDRNGQAIQADFLFQQL